LSQYQLQLAILGASEGQTRCASGLRAISSGSDDVVSIQKRSIWLWSSVLPHVEDKPELEPVRETSRRKKLEIKRFN